MPILYSDDFDGEGEGTSPPINWVTDTVLIPLNCEVDDAQDHSAPHSMYLKAKAGNHAWAHHNHAVGFTTERIVLWIYFPDATKARTLVTQDIIGNYNSGAEAAYIGFRDDGDIEYFDGDWQDTGQNYTAGWHKIEIVQNFATDTFDMWYDTVQIVTNGGFRNVADSCKSIQLMCHKTNQAEMWMDDVQIGEEGWSGNFNGRDNPPNINGRTVDEVQSVNGVPSA